MRDIDKVDLDTVHHVCKLATEDPFWKANFQSVLKLRQKNKDGIIYIKYFINYFKQKIKQTMEHQSNNNLSLQNQAEKNIQDTDYKFLLTLSVNNACINLGEGSKIPMQHLYNNIQEEFSNIDIKLMIRAIKNGSTGKFGSVYKFTICEVMIWIRKQIAIENESNKGYTIEEQRKIFGS